MQAAEALKTVGCFVEPVRIPALERDFTLDVFNRLHVMEMKPAKGAQAAALKDNVKLIYLANPTGSGESQLVTNANSSSC